MREIGIDELRQIQLNILKTVHKFCIEKGLKYSLGGGTLLGAVRHKGYIPWDDDIDIMMPRPDYNIFVKEFNGYKQHIICGAYENNKDFIYPFAKVYDNRTYWKETGFIKALGVNIDLFPVDGFPDKDNNEKEFNAFFDKLDFWKEISAKKVFGNLNWKLRLLKVIFFFIPINFIQKKISTIIQTYDFETSKYVGAVIGTYGKRECYLHIVFEKYIELPFEGMNLMVIKDYDEYLKGHYGNYMKLPPVEQQVGHHTTEAFWIN